MKKLSMLVLSLALCFSLTACGGGGDQPAPGGDGQPASGKVTFPTKSIEVYVPFSAGGQTDILARMVTQYLPKYLPANVPVVVVNEPGAGGVIGTQKMLSKNPDGYSFGLVTTNILSTSPLTQDLSTDLLEEVKILRSGMNNIQFVSVNANAPYKTGAELIEYWKANKDKPFNVAVLAVGTTSQVCLELIAKELGIKFTYIPYGSTGECQTALYQGEVDALLGWPINIDETKQRVILSFASERSKVYPDVATCQEVGVPIAADYSRMDFVVDKDVPEDIIAILDNALKQTLADPELVKAAELVPLEIASPELDSAKCTQLLHEERELVMPYFDQWGILKDKWKTK